MSVIEIIILVLNTVICIAVFAVTGLAAVRFVLNLTAALRARDRERTRRVLLRGAIAAVVCGGIIWLLSYQLPVMGRDWMSLLG
ncbi:MAG: hypothetical protein K2O10_07590 [Muribaculaceae bacterium]|nr:hypothetical protein [Muribaculaceae bacterium]